MDRFKQLAIPIVAGYLILFHWADMMDFLFQPIVIIMGMAAGLVVLAFKNNTL